MSASALMLANTSVYVVNKTPFDLPATYSDQDGGTALDKGSLTNDEGGRNVWTNGATTIPAGQTKELIKFSRNQGIKNQAYYYFKQVLDLPNLGNLYLKQRLRGTATSSDIWLAVTANEKDYSWITGDRTPHSLTIDNGPHHYTIRFYLQARSAAYDDAYYEISYKRDIDASRRYNETTFLTAHNAFSNYEDGWKNYNQQQLNLIHQLEYGVRALMLDVYDYKNEIVFCHRSCSGGGEAQRSLGEAITGGNYKKLTDTLAAIKTWLDQNPQEVVTLFFENYVDNDKLAGVINGVPGVANMILTKQIWDAKQNNQQWPTLQWMRDNNKRIVMFNENKSGTAIKDTHPFFPTWDYITESAYSTIDPEKVCVQRSESAASPTQQRGLLLINFFEQISLSSSNNTYNNLKKVLNLCNQRGLGGSGKRPNFIAIDFVNRGDGLRLVNELNAQ
jgi:hypothetical protein